MGDTSCSIFDYDGIFYNMALEVFHTKKLLDFKLDKRNIFISTIVISSQIFALFFISKKSIIIFAIAIILILTLFLFHQSNIRKVFYIGGQFCQN